MIIDTHAHIYYVTGEERYSYAQDQEEVIERAKLEGVQRILLPNVDLESYPQMMALVDAHPDFCAPMIGLHPTSVSSDYQKVLGLLEVELRKEAGRFIGVGEIGLDYHWDLTYRKEMEEAFRQQIEWALEFDLPVSVHSRDAEDDVLRILSEYPKLRGVIHAFGGNREQFERALELKDFLIGVTGVVTYKKSGLKEILKELSLIDRIVVETDAPYLAPVPFRGKRNESSYLKYVMAEMAQIFECDETWLRERIFENSVKMFNLAP